MRAIEGGVQDHGAMKLVTSPNQSHHPVPNHASPTGVPWADSGSWMLLFDQNIHFGQILTNGKTPQKPGTSVPAFL